MYGVQTRAYSSLIYTKLDEDFHIVFIYKFIHLFKATATSQIQAAVVAHVPSGPHEIGHGLVLGVGAVLLVLCGFEVLYD